MTRDVPETTCAHCGGDMTVTRGMFHQLGDLAAAPDSTDPPPFCSDMCREEWLYEEIIDLRNLLRLSRAENGRLRDTLGWAIQCCGPHRQSREYAKARRLLGRPVKSEGDEEVADDQG